MIDAVIADTSVLPDPEELSRLEARLQGGLSGRVSALELRWDERGLVLRGRSRTYYGKQLAQHLLMRVTNIPICANEIRVV